MGSPSTVDGKPGLSLRMGKMKAGPVVSDNGNFIIDAPFPESMMVKPEEVGASRKDEADEQLLVRIKMLTGVVEVGLFCGMAKAAYFGNEDGSVQIRNEDGTVDKVDTVPDVPELARLVERD